MERCPRDFLRRFVGNGSGDEMVDATEGDSDEIELSLGLSLGGCFGADPKGKKLVRSSSVASFLTLPKEPEFPAVPASALTRTSSLPTETEEELRKRKEIQSLKRLAAKRKRLERRNSIRSGAAKSAEKPDDDVNGGKGSAAAAAEQTMTNSNHQGSTGGGHFNGARNGVAPPGLPTWAAAPKRVAARPADLPNSFPPISQVSTEIQGVCTTTANDGDGQVAQALNSSIIRSASNHINSNETIANPETSGTGKAQISIKRGESMPKSTAARANGVKEMERKMMEKMPFVSTHGEGPNGRRIEGFLYKYRRGEEVRIVCVCHGSFLTPAEFVKHAGGRDVTNPLRHIVVNSSPFSL
ncbi:ninja-family protein 6-like [Canna indica]|uniref:Ninja-family protein n=1 Tax=Canna indica TaxID=4628 RepID=A0AAQ3QNE8_9LILI|nr:ninja-family protein 6-like [Canna indica]